MYYITGLDNFGGAQTYSGPPSSVIGGDQAPLPPPLFLRHCVMYHSVQHECFEVCCAAYLDTLNLNEYLLFTKHLLVGMDTHEWLISIDEY